MGYTGRNNDDGDTKVVKTRFSLQAYYARGFTLIEVTIALVILSMTLSSAMYAVHQYADERIRMKDRFLANQVAWNNLMNRYQHSKGWTSGRDRTALKTKGVDEQGGQEWQWNLDTEKAMGENLYRFQVQVGVAGSDRLQGSLAVYLVGN